MRRRCVLGSVSSLVAVGTAGCLGVLDRSDGDPSSGRRDVDRLEGGWPFHGHDVRNSRRGETAGPTSEPELAWERGTTFSGRDPTIADSLVYQHDPERGFVGVEATTGEAATTAEWTDDRVSMPHAATTDVVVATERGDDQSLLVVRETATGNVRWERPVPSGIRPGTIGIDDDVLFATTDVAGPGPPAVVAIRMEDGETHWREEFPEPAVSLGVGERVVAASVRSHLFGFDREGGSRRWIVPFDASLTTSPVMAGDRVVVGDAGGTVYAITRDGTKEWTQSVSDDPVTGLAMEGDVVYASSSAGVVELALESGDRARHLADAEASGCTVAGNVLYGFDSGLLVAVDRDTGETLWTVSADFDQLLGLTPLDGWTFATGTRLDANETVLQAFTNP